jgi:hypothetical protein
MVRTYSTNRGEEESRVLVRNPEGNNPLGRPRRRWEGNVINDLRVTG